MKSLLKVLVAMPVLAMMLTACSGVGSNAYDRVPGDGEFWSVGVADPRFDSRNSCLEDPSILTSVQSADLPSSRLGIELVSGATEEDAVRIADCLSAALVSGEISIGSPSK